MQIIYDTENSDSILQPSVVIALLVSTLFHCLLFQGYVLDRLMPATTLSKLSLPPSVVFGPEVQFFTETNPLAPENEPDFTLYEAARSQQAAQEMAIHTGNDVRPKVDGELLESTAIVSFPYADSKLEQGHYTLREYSESESQNQPTLAETEFHNKPAVSNKPKGEMLIAQKNFNLEGYSNPFGTTEIPIASDVLEINPQDSKINYNTPDDAQSITALPKPLPRVTLTGTSSQSVLSKSEGRPLPIGTIAVDAKVTPFGSYIERVKEAVCAQWNLLASTTPTLSLEPSGRVVVEYTLDSNGDIKTLQILETTTGNVATLLCKDAIVSRAPFGKWPAEKIALKTEETIRFTFYYH
jgi:hypothetical protein